MNHRNYCANSRLKGKWRRSALTWLLSILFCGEAFGAEFDSEFNAHRKAVEQPKQPPSNVLKTASPPFRTIQDFNQAETPLALSERFNHTGSQEGKYDPYSVLGISRGASSDEVREAYRRLISYWHPDRNRSPDAEDMSTLISRAYTDVQKDLEGGGEKTNILHTTIQSALSAIANGSQSAGRADRDLKNTLEILLEDPAIRQSINTVMEADSLSHNKPVYKQRGTPLQMALYLPASAALLLANGADAEASGPDLLPPVDQVLSRRTSFYPAYNMMPADVNFEAFKFLLKHGKIDLNRISVRGETTLEMIMFIAAGFLNSSMSTRHQSEQTSKRARQMRRTVCPPNSLCEYEHATAINLYCSSCDDKRRGNQWKKLFFQLINDGFDLNLKNAKGQTILDRAIAARNKEISRQLIDRFGKSIDWEYTNNQGRTYLDLAIASGDEVLALKIIKTAGADMAYRNPEGENYLESALRANFRKLSLFIAQNGGFEGVEPDERTRLIAHVARDRNHSFLRKITRLSLSADQEGKPLMITGKIHNGAGGGGGNDGEGKPLEGKPLMITGKIHNGAGGVGGNDGSGDESGGRRGPKFKRGGPTRGEWGMIAGAAAGTGFSAIHGGGGFDILSSATFGAIALGFPLVFVDNCRFLFSHFKNRSASKPPVQLD